MSPTPPRSVPSIRATEPCTRDAPPVQLRPLDSSDAGTVAALLARLSPRSRYLRFFTPTAPLPEELLRRLTEVDHAHHEAVGAFEGDLLVGVAHYFRSAGDPAEAELSVEVADTHQRRGLGGCLLRALAVLARRRGIARFTATVLTENRPARSLIHRSGWPVVSEWDGTEVNFAMTLAA